MLSIDYASKYQPAAVESRPFVLDISAPTGSIAVDRRSSRPVRRGRRPCHLTIEASSALARMDSWSLDVFDAAGGVVKTGAVSAECRCSVGRNLPGRRIRHPRYLVQGVATVRDEYGNSARLKSDIAVAALSAPSSRACRCAGPGAAGPEARTVPLPPRRRAFRRMATRSPTR